MSVFTILLISGSLREGSSNGAALRTAELVAPPDVATVRYVGMAELPHFNPDDDREGAPVHPAVARLREVIAAADALLLCTPEYAGALPGALKNLLEWTVGDGGTYDKPVAWINVSGPAAPTGGADAHDSLRKVLRYTGAAIVEAACARIPVTRDQVGAAGTIADAGVRKRIAASLAALAAGAGNAAAAAPPPNRVRRIVPDLPAADPGAGRAFYAEVLGLEVAMDHGWIVTYVAPGNPTAQVSAMAGDASAPVRPAASIEVEDVDAAHAAAQRLGCEIVHPLTDEPWGVRRFFVRDPAGNVLNVLAHRG